MKSSAVTLVLATALLVGLGEGATKKLKRIDGLTPASPKVALLQTSLLQKIERTQAVTEENLHVGLGHERSAAGESSWSWAKFKAKYAPDETWYVGIAATILGQTICVIGMQMQKISHLVHTPSAAGMKSPHAKTLEDGMLGAVAGKELLGGGGALVDETSPYFTQWRWILGSVVWGLGHIMCWAAMGLAPLSILSCLQSWNIVIALALAPVILNETLPPRAVECACLLVVGCIVVVWYGPRDDHYEFETADTLGQLFIAPESLVVHFVCLGFLLLSFATSLMQDKLWRVERYVLMSATCAWYSALCSKSMSMLVITSVADREHDIQFKHIGFWLFAVCFGIFAVGQVHFMNVGLKYGTASAVMPLYEGVSMLGQLFFGGILFREFHHFRGNDEIGFIVGVVIVFISLGFLIKANRDMAVSAELASQDVTVPQSEGDKLQS